MPPIPAHRRLGFFGACFAVSAMLAGVARADVLSYRMDTVAGSDWVGDNGPAIGAILLQAEGIVADTYGNLYVADAGGQRVREITPAGVISTVAGTGIQGFSGDGGPASAAQLNSPYGLAFDAGGNLYIADLGNGRVRRVAPGGIITTVAGGGALAAGGVNDGSPATAVALLAPRNVTLDASGNLYISDFNGHRVYELNPGGTLTTVAGTGVQGFSGDGGPAPFAQLAFPAGLAFDRQGALYIADSQNHYVRKVAGGLISSIVREATPTGLAFDAGGTLYITDPPAGTLIRTPVTGPAAVFTLTVSELAFSSEGFAYATAGSTVLRISFTGPQTAGTGVVAGGGSLAHGDGGPASAALLNHPSGVAADSSGNVYIADRDNNRIRRIAQDGTIATIAGTGVAGGGGDGGLAALAQLDSPTSVSVDAAGNLYVADTGNQRVRKITASGVIFSVFAPSLISPACAIADHSGNIYIADAGGGTIFQVSASGVSTTLLTGLASPRGLALDGAGNLYFTEESGQRVQMLGSGGVVTNLAAGSWNIPRGIAVSADGSVFVADTGLQQIVRIDSSGQIAPVAGNGSAGYAGDGGPALSAELGFPWSVAAGPAGTVLIADLANNRVRVATPEISVLNAASLQPGPVAAGMLLAVQGTGLSAADVPNVQVLFGTSPGLVLSANSAGLLVQSPATIAGLGSVQVQILNMGIILAQSTVTVAAAAPALFTAASGQVTSQALGGSQSLVSAQALASNQDGSVNSAANPAQRGSVIVLYGTGQGVSGQAISVQIGGQGAEVLYAGPVAGYPGLLQINAVIPGSIAPGNSGVSIAVGPASSQPGIVIAVY